MSTLTSFHCPNCGHRYAPMLVINWAKRVKCGKCKRPFQVSPEAFRNNCMLVFAVYSFLPFWLLSTVVIHVAPLPEGNPFLGKLALGALCGLILACFFMGVGWSFGYVTESRRYQPSVKKRRRKERVRCPACGKANDPSETDECEHCGEEL